MQRYIVWFRGNRDRTEMRIAAVNRFDAIQVFADHHGVKASSYIQAKLVAPAARMAARTNTQ